jgi:thiaminase
MPPRYSKISDSFIFGWYTPMWLLMGAIPAALLGLNMFTRIPEPHEDHIRSLIEANQQLWEDLVNHPFPRQMARGTAPLNGFRHYMIQDATYMEYYTRVRMLSIASSRSKASFKDLENFGGKMSNSLQYAKIMRDACEKQLGIPQEVVSGEPESQQLKNSIALYERVAQEGDWLDMHIVLLPCIMGYYTIASKLLVDPATIRNTLYYTLWIQEHAKGGTFERYKKFIADHINTLPDSEKREKWKYWVDIFGKACQTEKAFLDLAYEDLKYDVISDGRYKIRTYGNDGLYLVPDAGGRVMAQQDDPDENQTWELTNARDGYLIRNVAAGALLGVSVTEQFPPYYEVNSKGEGCKSWSLNPISVAEKQMYQLSVSSNLRFMLDVHIGENSSKVFVTNGYTGSNQLWLLEPVASVAGEF